MKSETMAKFLGFLILFITAVSGIHGFDPEASITGLYTGPYFDPLAARNFTAHLGDQAVLPCTVRQLGDKSVSWVRMRDADILTVDRYTFVGDERFESSYSAPLETWNLVIKYVQERDAGLYECQVSTEPKMSQLFTLRVVIPKVSIMPPGDRYVKAGSEVRVDCQITDVVQLPDYIFWYHEDKRVMDHLDSNLMVTVKKTGVEAITSTLTVYRVPPHGSGNYTCMPSNLHTASVILHVLNEKHPAAMQGERSGCGTWQTEAPSHLLLLLLVFVMLWGASYSEFNEGNSERTSERDQQKPLGGASSFSGEVILSSCSASSLCSLSSSSFPSSYYSTCPFQLDQVRMKKVLTALEDDVLQRGNVYRDEVNRVHGFLERLTFLKCQTPIAGPRVICWSRVVLDPPSSRGILEVQQPLMSIMLVLGEHRKMTHNGIINTDVSQRISETINIDSKDSDDPAEEEMEEGKDLFPQDSFRTCHSDLRQWTPLALIR